MLQRKSHIWYGTFSQPSRWQSNSYFLIPSVNMYVNYSTDVEMNKNNPVIYDNLIKGKLLCLSCGCLESYNDRLFSAAMHKIFHPNHRGCVFSKYLRSPLHNWAVNVGKNDTHVLCDTINFKVTNGECFLWQFLHKETHYHARSTLNSMQWGSQPYCPH